MQRFTCSVELEFEHDDVIYIMKRIEVFFRSRNGIEHEQTVELSTIASNGERSLPERDKDIVEKRLTDIIPKSILYGIIFDGERMKQLSSVDEVSKTAVEGVIRHITNEELFELCRTEITDLENKVSSELKKAAKKRKNNDLESIVNKIENYTGDLNVDKTILRTKRERLEFVQMKLADISSELKKNETSKIFEQKRIESKAELDRKNKELETATDEFYKNLYEGYLLISTPLFNDVTESIEHKDVPFGLTVEAVKSILNRPKCICGHDICADEKRVMEELIESLPPDNISSTINEMLRQTEMHVDDVKKSLKTSFTRIEELQKEIEKIKKDIVFSSTQIVDGAPEKIKKLELENRKFVIEDDQLNADINKLESNIKCYNDEILRLTKEKEECKGTDAEVRFFNTKYDFIRKCQKALNEIDEYNKKISLENINGKINEAYSQISEDYIRGRRLYIVQFDAKQKYRLVSYYQYNYDSMSNKLTEDGTVKSLSIMGKDENEIHEYIIMKVLESNSTGQSKINTLAFAKAILDYSNEERDESSTEITKNYPFLIDSPFTELTDENLSKSAASLHKFTNQVILMSSADSLASVEDSILPYVGCRNYLVKADNESFSTLKESE